MFEVDEVVWLDRGTPSESLVTIVKFYTDKRLYVRIEDQHGQRWTVMIFRLSKP